MFFNDHAPAHFHVKYGVHKAVIDDIRSFLRKFQKPQSMEKLAEHYFKATPEGSQDRFAAVFLTFWLFVAMQLTRIRRAAALASLEAKNENPELRHRRLCSRTRGCSSSSSRPRPPWYADVAQGIVEIGETKFPTEENGRLQRKNYRLHRIVERLIAACQSPVRAAGCRSSPPAS